MRGNSYSLCWLCRPRATFEWHYGLVFNNSSHTITRIYYLQLLPVLKYVNMLIAIVFTRCLLSWLQIPVNILHPALACKVRNNFQFTNVYAPVSKLTWYNLENNIVQIGILIMSIENGNQWFMNASGVVYKIVKLCQKWAESYQNCFSVWIVVLQFRNKFEEIFLLFFSDKIFL